MKNTLFLVRFAAFLTIAAVLLVAGMPGEARAQEEQLVNGSFEDEGEGWTFTRLNGDVESEYVIPGTEGEPVTMYMGVKVGRWNDVSELDFSVSIDELSLVDATATDVDTPGELPEQFAIESVYPNPFNPSTTLAITINAIGAYSMRVHNILGQAVHDREVIASTTDRMELPLDLSEQVSGLYLISVEHAATGHIHTTRAMLLK